MKVKPSYRIVQIPGLDADEMWEQLIAEGELVLDTHLPGIADAWEAYKQAKNRGENGGREFVVLALRLDRALTEEEK